MMLERNDAGAKAAIDEIFTADLTAPYCGWLVKDGEAVAGVVVLNNYEQGLSVDLTFAGRLDARAARELCRIIFDDLKVRRVTAVTRMSNAFARAALLRFGFVREGVLRCRFANEDGIIYGLLRSDLKFRF